jgi:lysozyme
MTIRARLRLRVLFAAAALTSLGVAAFALFDSGIVRFNYPSRDRFPIQGIDVSHHQGRIDWPRVAAAKTVQFAYIKATEGGDYRDASFARNWLESRQAGIVRGAYHFFTLCRPGRDQAKNYLATVPREADALPIAVDLEFLGNCGARPSPQAFVAELLAFLDEIRKVDPRTPVFYVTYEFYDRYLKDNIRQVPAHHLWLRNIFYEPAQKSCERWRLWQFAHRGRLEGIAGPVDLDVFCGDRAAFAGLLAPATASN